MLKQLYMDYLLKSHFPGISINNCLKIISDSHFYVYDCPHTKQSTITLTEPAEQNFKVSNINSKPIRFLSIDNCLFFNGDDKKCDFALYDEISFCFVEIKGIRKDEHRKRKNAKRNAEIQLLAMIELFQNKLDFSNIKLEAYLCVGYATTRPSTLSKSQRAKRDFVKLKTKLYDGCQKSFHD